MTLTSTREEVHLEAARSKIGRRMSFVFFCFLSTLLLFKVRLFIIIR